MRWIVRAFLLLVLAGVVVLVTGEPIHRLIITSNRFTGCVVDVPPHTFDPCAVYTNDILLWYVLPLVLLLVLGASVTGAIDAARRRQRIWLAAMLVPALLGVVFTVPALNPEVANSRFNLYRYSLWLYDLQLILALIGVLGAIVALIADLIYTLLPRESRLSRREDVHSAAISEGMGGAPPPEA